jgi:hypothetical protein
MWKGELDLVSEAPVDEPVSIAELETGDQVVRVCDLDIGFPDRRGNPKLSGIKAGPKCRPSERLNPIC